MKIVSKPDRLRAALEKAEAALARRLAKGPYSGEALYIDERNAKRALEIAEAAVLKDWKSGAPSAGSRSNPPDPAKPER